MEELTADRCRFEYLGNWEIRLGQGSKRPSERLLQCHTERPFSADFTTFNARALTPVATFSGTYSDPKLMKVLNEIEEVPTGEIFRDFETTTTAKVVRWGASTA